MTKKLLENIIPTWGVPTKTSSGWDTQLAEQIT